MDRVKHHSWPTGPDTASCPSWISPFPCQCPKADFMTQKKAVWAVTNYMNHGAVGQVYTLCSLVK